MRFSASFAAMSDSRFQDRMLLAEAKPMA